MLIFSAPRRPFARITSVHCAVKPTNYSSLNRKGKKILSVYIISSLGGGLFVYLHKYVRFPSKDKQKFVMIVLFDTMALHYVYRLGCPRLEKVTWDSLVIPKDEHIFLVLSQIKISPLKTAICRDVCPITTINETSAGGVHSRKNIACRSPMKETWEKKQRG